MLHEELGKDLDVGLVRELLEYDPFTGEFIWLERERYLFTSDTAHRYWNKRYANKSVGVIKSNGYVNIRFKGVQYLAHRLAWLYVYGEYPIGDIDHINHNRSDNSLSNLRVVSRKENQRNQSKFKNNTSGATGVRKLEGKHKWVSVINVEGSVKYLGTFNTKNEAVKTREDANIIYGFHKNHGK